ncbi:MAG: LacI family DNA-binding transcriptional regulator [Saprospiraceae bacterium]|nr:LacI family DNA-binding transcriptional regulator [Saprospiraceae bacterium]
MAAEKNKPIGIKKIAELANVSIGTVDRVIHDRGGVAPATRKRVLQLLNEHAYKPNILASRLKLASRKKIKLVALLPELSYKSNYWELHMQGIQRALEELQELGVVMEVHKFKFLQPLSFRRKLQSLFQQDFDGLITVPFYPHEVKALIEWSGDQNMPLAFLDSQTALPFAGFATYQDASEAGQVAGRLMNTLAPSTENVFVFQTSRDGRINANSRDRAASFMRFLDEHGEASRRYTVLQHRLEDEESLTITLDKELQNINDFAVFVTNSRSYLVA